MNELADHFAAVVVGEDTDHGIKFFSELIISQCNEFFRREEIFLLLAQRFFFTTKALRAQRFTKGIATAQGNFW
ncbi:MAG: hypothetical protein ACTHOB_12410 [Ginsengibacter sp.]